MVVLDIGSRGEAVVQLLTVIVIFIFVLGLTYFATRFVGSYQKNKMLGNNIEVKETLRLSNTKYIQLIKIGSQYIAIAVCKDTITYLGEIQSQDLEFKEISPGLQVDNFKAILDRFKKDKPED